MPAALPGSTAEDNGDNNPSAGRFVIFDPLSGPKGSPLDEDADGNASTGALQTGIGFGSQVIGAQDASAPVGIFKSGFNDNGIPGEVPTYSAPPPNGVVSSNAIDSTRMYIGGGRTASTGATLGRPFPPDPYTAGIAICGAGQGASRDGGGSAPHTGFPLKAVTASGAVSAGAAIEAGWENRSGVAMVSGQSSHGASTTELAAAS